MSSQFNKHNDNKQSRLVGAFATIFVNIGILCLLLFTVSLTAPQPQMTVIALEIVPDEDSSEPIEVVEEVRPVLQPKEPDVYALRPQERTSSGARSDVVVPKEPAAQSAVGPDGDVELPDKNMKPTDNRSIFQSDDSGTAMAQAVGEKPDARTLYRGASEGQDIYHKADNVSSWSLGGRYLVGKDHLDEPSNNSNKEGRVVVEIVVNQAGKVIQAKASAHGSTVQDAALWKAAEEAAMKTTFNVNYNAQAAQTGTITYIFKLR